MFSYFHRSARPDLIALLRTVAKGHAFPSLSLLKDREVSWIIEAGLGPLFWFESQKDAKTKSHSRDFKAADLTTRLINQIQLETLSEILLRCKGLLPPITLLKGSSTGSELYPEPHLRVMRDLDLLVEPRDQPKLESILVEIGFQQRSTNNAEFYATHHHSMPFYHGGKDVWVEVHRGLWPDNSQLAKLVIFNPQNITAELRPSLLKGIPVMRLSTELQIVYTASHWALDLKRRGGLFPFLDIIYLLRRAQQNIRWDAIFKWVQGSVAATHLYLVLSYLNKNKIIDLDNKILADLFGRQRSFGTLNLKIAHYLITRYIVAGKIPISSWKLAAFWDNLLLDHGAARNLISASKNIFPSFGLRRAALN
ncbi:MAG TPA: nucleotidyltransferase family protein [Candidatus Binatia bacterium]|nr:nucleotidyltransferase family protein [Candidatus Binatia bacterium]